MKYDILSTFMEHKATRVRDEHKLLEFRRSKYNTPKYHPKIEPDSDSDSDSVSDENPFSITALKERRSTNNELKIPLVRASFKTKKPSNQGPLSSAFLRCGIELNQDNYNHLIGYIDALGVFCLNNKEGFDPQEERHVTEQLRLSNNSIFEFNPVKQWKIDLHRAYNLVTEIMDDEITKGDFEEYYSHVIKVSLKINNTTIRIYKQF